MNSETANILLGVMANVVRFCAIKKMIDIFLPRRTCRMEHIWILYVVACCCTSLTYEIFKSPGWTVVANLIVLFVVVLPYQVKMSKRLVLIFFNLHIKCDG